MKKVQPRVILYLILATVSLFAADKQDEKKNEDKYEPVLFEALRPKVGRALIEAGTVYLVSSVNYWHKYANFIADWQFTLTWKDQAHRFLTTDDIRFDSNNYYLNWGHGLAGMAYYNLFRCNRVSAAGSAMAATIFAVSWEYISEWREVISINDIIFGSVGGSALGETLFQISRYFSSRSGWGNRIAQTAFNPISSLNDILDGRFRSRAAYAPIVGDYRFRLFVGLKDGPVTSGGRNPRQSDVALDFRMMPIPEYGQIGSFGEFMHHTLSVRFHFDLAASRAGIEEYRFGTRVVWAGYFAQELAAGKGGAPQGWQFIAGLGSGYDFYRQRTIAVYDSDYYGSISPRAAAPRPTDFRDKMAEVNLAGPSLSYTLFRPSWSLRATAEAYLDFGMVGALALNQYSIDHAIDTGKTTVMAWGYYYGLGCTLRGGLELAAGPVSLAAELTWQRYGSIEGRDRFANLVTDDFHLSDSRTLFSLEAAFKLPRLPLQLSAVYEGVGRWGRIRTVEVSSHENRFFYRLVYWL